MKKMIIGAVAATLMTLSAQAATVVAKVSAVNQEIQSVELLNDGSLRLTQWNHDQSIVTLKSNVSAELLYAAKSLSSIKLETEHHPIVCMMMVPTFEIHTLYIINEEGVMNTVLTGQSCAISSNTFPIDKYQKEAATKLRAELMVLATQLAQ